MNDFHPDHDWDDSECIPDRLVWEAWAIIGIVCLSIAGGIYAAGKLFGGW